MFAQTEWNVLYSLKRDTTSKHTHPSAGGKKTASQFPIAEFFMRLTTDFVVGEA